MDEDMTREMPKPAGGWQAQGEGAMPDATQPAEPAGQADAGSEDLAEVVAAVGVRPAASHVEVPNEAFPAVPPKEGEDPLGSIPAVSAQRRWARAQLANWRLFLVRFVCAGIAVIAAVALVPGLDFTSWRWGQFTQIAIMFGLLNATVKPALQFLVLRFIFSTYGVVVIVINAILLAMLAWLMGDVLTSTGLLPLLLGGLAVGAFGLLLETVLGANPPVLDRDYKERNGIA